MSESVAISRSCYASKSADEAWDALSRMYTRARPHAASRDASIRFDTVTTTDLAIDRGWLGTARGDFDSSPDQLNIITVVDGRIGLDFGRRGTVSNVAGDSYLYPPDSGAHLSWDGFGALALRLPRRVVTGAAHELTGIDPAALHFTGPRPVSASRARLWLHTVEGLWRQLSAADDQRMNALVLQQLITATASVALSVFPSTAMSRGYVAGPGDVRPAVVRRAVAYVDAHASLPISVADIAAAADTEPHAITAAFRQHLDTTPAAYLKRTRLDAAHHDMRTADADDPAVVQEIAGRWGFADVEQFATEYRAAFRGRR